MRHLTKGIAALAAASLALGAAGCNKGPAEAALQAADQALAAARTDVERYVPEEFASLSGDLAAARAELENGHYTEALKAAQALPARIDAAVAAAGQKKVELTGAWTDLSASLPPAVQAITDEVAALAASSSLPRGMTKDLVVSYQRDLDTIRQAWNDAATAFQGGDVPRAVRTAQDVKARAEALAAALGLAAAPAAVAAK
jgi:hypothetical protein